MTLSSKNFGLSLVQFYFLSAHYNQPSERTAGDKAYLSDVDDCLDDLEEYITGNPDTKICHPVASGGYRVIGDGGETVGWRKPCDRDGDASMTQRMCGASPDRVCSEK